MTKTFDKATLKQFTGSTTWYRHGLNRRVNFTNGAKYVADTAGGYWLLDEIALVQLLPVVKAEEFQVWKLTVRDDQSTTLACEDDNDRIVYSKEIEFTDFPVESIELWFSNDTVYLPSEN